MDELLSNLENQLEGAENYKQLISDRICELVPDVAPYKKGLEFVKAENGMYALDPNCLPPELFQKVMQALD